jgi:hypothetical protein
MISFAIKTLLSNRSKLFTGVAGVIFSLVLVNIQGGLYLADPDDDPRLSRADMVLRR